MNKCMRDNKLGVRRLFSKRGSDVGVDIANCNCTWPFYFEDIFCVSLVHCLFMKLQFILARAYRAAEGGES